MMYFSLAGIIYGKMVKAEKAIFKFISCSCTYNLPKTDTSIDEVSVFLLFLRKYDGFNSTYGSPTGYIG